MRDIHLGESVRDTRVTHALSLLVETSGLLLASLPELSWLICSSTH